MQVIFVLSASIALAESAKLLRTPKVYNAIITTDEMLTPSRAFPLIQPVIQPAIPVFSSFYPGLYDPYSQNSVSEGNGRDLNVRSFVETLRFFLDNSLNMFVGTETSREKIRRARSRRATFKQQR